MPSTQTAWAYLSSVHPSLTADFPNRPTNPEHIALLDLSIARELAFNPSRNDATLSAMSSRDIAAVLCQITGVEQPKSCKRCQTGCGMLDRCVVAPLGDSQDVMAGRCSNCFIDQCDQCIWNDGQRPAAEYGSPECRLSSANRSLPLSQAVGKDKHNEAALESTEVNGPSELQPDGYSDQDGLYNCPDTEAQSDGDYTPDDVELLGNGDLSASQTQSQPLTKKTIPYDEVYQMARDPQAKHKHCEYCV